MKNKTAIFFGIPIVLGMLTAYGFGAFGSKNVELNANEVKETFPPVSVSFKDVRAVYMTAPVAQTPSRVNKIISLIASSTELNAVVVNVKDEDGLKFGAWTKPLVVKLRSANIYPIARIVVFQDNQMAHARPDLALHDADGNLWSSGKGKYFWLDPSSREVWDYIAGVANQALDDGFKELNFDYVRFPSDGDMSLVKYPLYNGTSSMTAVIDEFFGYIAQKTKQSHPDAILSADIFAYNFITSSGLGIGQRAEDAAENFDVVSPMVYPSHYSAGNFGFENPAEHPYDVVRNTLEDGRKLISASSTAVIRPWIQDFDLGAVYDRQMVQEEIRAIKDAGYGDTWMVWNPRNVYEADKFSN